MQRRSRLDADLHGSHGLGKLDSTNVHPFPLAVMGLAVSFYTVLNVDEKAKPAEIRRAYHELARKHHPDLNPDTSEASLRFKIILRAYEVLSDPQQRREYNLDPTQFEAEPGQNVKNRSECGGKNSPWVTPRAPNHERQKSANGTDGRTGHFWPRPQPAPRGQTARRALVAGLAVCLASIFASVVFSGRTPEPRRGEFQSVEVPNVDPGPRTQALRDVDSFSPNISAKAQSPPNHDVPLTVRNDADKDGEKVRPGVDPVRGKSPDAPPARDWPRDDPISIEFGVDLTFDGATSPSPGPFGASWDSQEEWPRLGNGGEVSRNLNSADSFASTIEPLQIAPPLAQSPFSHEPPIEPNYPLVPAHEPNQFDLGRTEPSPRSDAPELGTKRYEPPLADHQSNDEPEQLGRDLLMRRMEGLFGPRSNYGTSWQDDATNTKAPFSTWHPTPPPSGDAMNGLDGLLLPGARDPIESGTQRIREWSGDGLRNQQVDRGNLASDYFSVHGIPTTGSIPDASSSRFPSTYFKISPSVTP